MADSLRTWLIQKRFAVLLISLLGLALLEPILASFGFVGAKLLLNIFLTIILFSSVYAVSQNRRLFIITLCLGIPAIGFRWVIPFFGSSLAVLLTIQATTVIFLFVIAGTILSYVLKHGAVTGEKISASVCVYLLVGLLWAFLYSLTFHLQPGSFQLESPQLSEFVYYSFITLSTLGYGDIIPLSPPARALSYVEAITGQLYLTVLVARLVGLHIAYTKE
ncbi:MAG: two pore domain potassium channel family protein [Deltaproteobacteria bacterium]|nr:two pore domain potassium channel family protein [Deltaproteobacteria bacterium]